MSRSSTRFRIGCHTGVHVRMFECMCRRGRKLRLWYCATCKCADIIVRPRELDGPDQSNSRRQSNSTDDRNSQNPLSPGGHEHKSCTTSQDLKSRPRDAKRARTNICPGRRRTGETALGRHQHRGDSHRRRRHITPLIPNHVHHEYLSKHTAAQLSRNSSEICGLGCVGAFG